MSVCKKGVQYEAHRLSEADLVQALVISQQGSLSVHKKGLMCDRLSLDQQGIMRSEFHTQSDGVCLWYV